MSSQYLDLPIEGSGTAGVTSLNSLTGALTLAAGTNITITPSGGDTLTIASTGGGGGMTIGDPVIDGDAGSILFVDTDGNLSQDNPNFIYATSILTIPDLIISNQINGVLHVGGSGAVTSSLIVDSDVDAAAAIEGTKISPDFGAQEILTSQGINIASDAIILSNNGSASFASNLASIDTAGNITAASFIGDGTFLTGVVLDSDIGTTVLAPNGNGSLLTGITAYQVGAAPEQLGTSVYTRNNASVDTVDRIFGQLTFILVVDQVTYNYVDITMIVTDTGTPGTFSSTLSGDGSSGNHFVYTATIVNDGGSFSSNAVLITLFNNDPNAANIFICTGAGNGFAYTPYTETVNLVPSAAVTILTTADIGVTVAPNFNQTLNTTDAVTFLSVTTPSIIAATGERFNIDSGQIYDDSLVLSHDVNLRKFYAYDTTEVIDYSNNDYVLLSTNIIAETYYIQNKISYVDEIHTQDSLVSTDLLVFDVKNDIINDLSNILSISPVGRELVASDGITISQNYSDPTKIVFGTNLDATGFNITGKDGILSGNLILNGLGQGIQINTGANGKAGLATLIPGAPSSVTVSTTAVHTGSLIFVTARGASANHGFVWVNNIIDATSFDIVSSEASDDSEVSWLIIDPS